MAEVYKVKTVGIAGFEKVQALKRIRPHFAHEPRFIRSFIDEARIAAELNHRNVVQVFDFGKAGGELFLAMELIDGVDLRTALGAARSAEIGMPIPVACHVLGEVASGLDYAHRKTDHEGQPLGIVHCDVSPQNVMLSVEGYVKILDFGVSRARFGARATTRRLRGKPRYMAPEQTLGERPTAAADVFALGIVAWELLTGMPLFEGRNLPEILASVRRADAPRADMLNPDVPAKVASAVARALSREPEARGSAGELGVVLSSTSQLVLAQSGHRALSSWLRQVYPDGVRPDSRPAPAAGMAAGTRTSVSADVTATGTGPRAGEVTPRPGRDAREDERRARMRGVTRGGRRGDDTAVDDTAVSSVNRTTVDVRLPHRRARMSTPELAWAEATETSPTGVGGVMVESIDDELDAHTIAPLFEKRRVVATAVLVSDSNGHSDLGRAVSELIEILSHLAYKHGAVIHEQRSGELVAVFGLEVAGEDDVAKAMTFALDAVEATRETNRTTGRQLEVRVAARAGIVATHQDGGYHLVGTAVAETRSLAREAAPSRPLLAGSGGRQTSTYYTFRPLPARPRRHRLPVMELVGQRSFDEHHRTLHRRGARFVGRAAELEALTELFDLAVAEDRRVVVAIEGASGIGKSRLVAELAARLRARAQDDGSPVPAVAAVAATPLGQVAPFTVLIDLVQVSLNLPPGRGQTARTRLIRRLRHALNTPALEPRDVDEVCAAVQSAMELRDGALVTPSPLPPRDRRERLVAALRAWRGAVLPRRRPTLVVLEDVHFADEPSMEVMSDTLGAHIAGSELVVITAHPSGADLVAEQLDARLSLGELSEDSRDELIRECLGAAATPTAVSAVARRAGGNPLFIEQIAAAVHAAGPTDIPASVRAVVLAQVDRLPARAKTVLQHAAVAGRQIRARILEEMIGADIDDELTGLCERGLLQRASGKPEDSGGELSFTRGLVREVVYDALASGARRRTHARLGQLLASRFRAGRDEIPAVIAEHLELGGEAAAAAAFWLRAGRLALAAFNATRAVEYFGRTLALDEQSPAAARSPAARARRREALLGREQAHRLLGRHEDQGRDLAALAAIARGDPALTADVKNRTAVRLVRMGDFQGALAAAEDAYRAAREVGDERGAGHALCLRGQVYERLGAYDRAIEMNRGAQEIFRRIEASADETTAMIGIGRALLTRARYDEAQIVYSAVVERVEDHGDPWLERQVRNHVAGIHLIMGQFDKAMAAVRRCLAICRRFGDRAREGDNLSMSGIILMLVGCYEPAREAFDGALHLHTLTGSRWSHADSLIYAGANEACLGAHEQAAAYHDEALATARAIGDPYLESNAQVARAGALLARARPGDVQRAEAIARAAVEVARQATLPGPEVQGLSRQAEALRRLGRLEHALALSRAAIDLLGRQKYVEGSEEEILLTHYQILDALADPDAEAVLAEALTGLERKRSALADPAWSEAFRAVPANARLLALSKR